MGFDLFDHTNVQNDIHYLQCFKRKKNNYINRVNVYMKKKDAGTRMYNRMTLLAYIGCQY